MTTSPVSPTYTSQSERVRYVSGNKTVVVILDGISKSPTDLTSSGLTSGLVRESRDEEGCWRSIRETTGVEPCLGGSRGSPHGRENKDK